MVSYWWFMCQAAGRETQTAKTITSVGSAGLVPYLEWVANGGISQPGQRSPIGCQWRWLRSLEQNTVLRFETLDGELQRLPFWNKARLPARNISVGKPGAEEVLNDEAIGWIQRIAAEDFDVYGYSREVPACT